MDDQSIANFAAMDSLSSRLHREVQSQYLYKPAAPVGASVTSNPRRLVDGSTVVDLTVEWEVERSLLYDVRVTPTGGDPTMYADITFSPLAILSFPTSTGIAVTIRAKHPISGFVGDWSPALAHTTSQDTVAPATPTNVAVSQIVGFGVAHLTWDTGGEADLAGYIIYKGQTTNPTTAYVLVYANVFDDPNVLTGETYFYRVQAFDHSKNYSSLSSNVFLTIS